MADALETIIKKKVGRLETVPNALADGTKKAQKQIFADILDLLGELDRDNGKILMSKKNLIKIDEIILKTKSVITGSDYVGTVRAFIKDFDEQAYLSKQMFDEMNVTITNKDLTAQMLKSAKKNAAELLLGTPIDTQFLQPIRGLLDDAVQAGASWSKTVQQIQTFAMGDDKIDGKLLRYSKQIASDAFATADRAYTNAVAEDNDFEWYLYTGGLLEDSREFCIDRNNKYFHYKEIEKWGNISQWQGRMPNTDPQTIFINAGGFNCKHSLIPQSVFAVPKADIQRNISNGNFKPSAELLTDLGL